MVPKISAFANLPTPLKVGLLVVSGGGIIAVFRYLPPGAFWVVFIGLAIVAVLLLLYLRLLKWLKKRKAAPMERDLLQSTSTTPQGISEPANVARLDDLRKKFGDGFQKFQSAGKSIYSFPWYMIVGEPGSGKTEAIRHCNVGFPPGLQDEFQGTGGTINMNWWFTDHAVLLDTAGRLMFEEVESGGSKEWKEFLDLLKKYRPRCPVNGVLLVIPSDSLIKDTADIIEQKASKIARQFDVIQRTLDVRFPVFVVITKSDLINGFRDFFDHLEDPQLQHQILGWSNPAPLDEAYNPDFVDQHYKAIQGRLFRRRLALLREVLSEEPGTGKMRTADTLYAFPQSLGKITTRMARYLELIFSVGSKWSGKSLFFRGIYFTSSMREGSALDEDLAESLGVPIDSLPDGRVWERDRAYFLRDLFTKKIFREQGLVTYATNANKQHRRRKTAVLISAAASVLLLFFLTLYARGQFRKSIGEVKSYFRALAALEPSRLKVIKKEGEGYYKYIGKDTIEISKEGDDVTVSNVSARLAGTVKRWDKGGGIPWIFAPVSKVANDFTPELDPAQAVIYELGVLRPFAEAARDMMRTEPNGDWTIRDPGTKALRQLVRLKANKPLSDKGGYAAQTFLDPFFEYVFIDSPNSNEDYNEDKEDLHSPISMIYESWPPASLKTDPNVPDAAIDRGVDLFNAYWAAPQSKHYAQAEIIKKLTNGLERFDKAEGHIIALKGGLDGETEPLEALEQQARVAFINNWNGRYDELGEAKESIDECVRSLGNPSSLADWWADTAKNATKEVTENYQFLLSELDPNELAKGSFLAEVRDRLEIQRDKILARLRLSEFEQRLKTLDDRFYARVQDRGPLYEIRFEMYSKANEQLSKSESVSGIDEVPGAMDEVDTAVTKAHSEINGLRDLKSDGFRVQEAAGICKLAVELGGRGRRDYVVESGLEEAIKRIRELVELPVGESYDPDVAVPVLHGWKRVGDWLRRPDLPEAEFVHVKQKYDDANPAYTKYTKGYLTYWLATRPKLWVQDQIPLKDNWNAQHQEWEKLRVLRVFSELEKFAEDLEKRALTDFEKYVAPGDETLLRFRKSKQRLNDKFFQDECRQIVANWSELSTDAFAARDTLLNYKPIGLVKDYFPLSPGSPAEFVETYWAELTYSSLRVLANEVKSEGQKAFGELKRKYGSKFPLDRDGGQDLTVSELKEARSLLGRVRSWRQHEPQTIGGGAKTDVDSVNEQIGKLREIRLGEADRQWGNGIQQILQALPDGQEPHYCSVTVLGQDEQLRLKQRDESLMIEMALFRSLGLVQGDTKGTPVRTQSGKNETVEPVIEYPSDDALRVDFYRLAGDVKPGTSLEFPAQWACLKMLRRHYEGRKEGCIRLDVKDGDKPAGVLYLQLEFFRDYDRKHRLQLPGMKDWPSLKK